MLWASTPFSIWFLDVGEGDATYFESAKGYNGLIDTGNVITGNRVIRFLKQRGINSLDILIVTHPHPDHMGGVFQILHNIEVKQRFDNGQPLPVKKDSDIYRWYDEFFRSENYRVLKRGDKLSLGEIILQILSPQYLQSDWNSNSIVILLGHKNSRILLMGDGTRSAELFLLENEKNLKAQILKIGHHGAWDTSDPKFLKAVGPKDAIISVNHDNKRGYPSPVTLNTLQKMGIDVWRTDKAGTIQFEEKKGILQTTSAVQN